MIYHPPRSFAPAPRGRVPNSTHPKTQKGNPSRLPFCKLRASYNSTNKFASLTDSANKFAPSARLISAYYPDQVISSAHHLTD
jgi:hypothetical protein